MPGKTRKGSDADSAKRLRKQLKKAEKRLATATKKRDEAQARLDALAVIAADLANRLAAAEKAAATTAAAPPAKKAPAKRTAKATARRTRSAASTGTKKPASSTSGTTRST